MSMVGMRVVVGLGTAGKWGVDMHVSVWMLEGRQQRGEVREPITRDTLLSCLLALALLGPF